jgi:hypothetical protein
VFTEAESGRMSYLLTVNLTALRPSAARPAQAARERDGLRCWLWRDSGSGGSETAGEVHGAMGRVRRRRDRERLDGSGVAAVLGATAHRKASTERSAVLADIQMDEATMM